MQLERSGDLRSCAGFISWAVIGLAFALQPGILRAGGQIINANQHPVDPLYSGPPFQLLLAAVGASSFHVNPDPSVFDLARSWNNDGKPRIISDDAGFQDD
jgi:hypothetical protein